MKRVLHERHGIFTVEQVLTKAECEELIAFAEGVGFAGAPITTPFEFANGQVTSKIVRAGANAWSGGTGGTLVAGWFPLVLLRGVVLNSNGSR